MKSLTTFLLLFSSACFACKCGEQSVSSRAKAAHTAFVGIAISAVDLAPRGIEALSKYHKAGKNRRESQLGKDYGIAVGFRVLVEKRNAATARLGDEVRGFTNYPVGGLCSVDIEVGKTYLVMLDEVGELMTCNATQQIDIESCGQVAFLRDLISGFLPNQQDLVFLEDNSEDIDLHAFAISGSHPFVEACSQELNRNK